MTDFLSYCITIMNRVSGRTLTPEDMEDVLMDVMVQLLQLEYNLQNGKPIQRPRDFVSFAGRIVRWRAVDFLRNRTKHHNGTKKVTMQVDAEAKQVVASGEGEQDLMEAREWVLAHFNCRDRAIVDDFWFYYLQTEEQPSNRELSEKYGVSRHHVVRVLYIAAEYIGSIFTNRS